MSFSLGIILGVWISYQIKIFSSILVNLTDSIFI
jgi:hypothetical protein